jgi:hypothetical protein
MVRSALSSWHVQINGVTRAGLLGKHRTPVLFNTTALLGSRRDQLFARGAISVGPTFMDCAQAWHTPSPACPSRRRDEAANSTLTTHQMLVKQIRARMLDPCGIARGRTCQANLHVSPLSDISVLRPLLEAHHRAAWRTWAPYWHGRPLSQRRVLFHGAPVRQSKI